MTKVNRSRLIQVSAAVCLMCLGIGARLYHLQVLSHDRLRQAAEMQQEQVVTVQARRGAIVDRNGISLASTLETFSLYAHPQRIEDPEHAATVLARALDISRADLLKRLRSEQPFVWVKRFLEPSTAAELQKLEIPIDSDEAFNFQPEPRRFYPYGKLGVHIVGFANIDGDGVEGIEQTFDGVLRGEPTRYKFQLDGRRRTQSISIDSPDDQPHDVVLSIDMVLQHLVEHELDDAMRRTGAGAATAILLDARTGEVLALANRPAADLARYSQASDAEKINRAAVHFYEPGSTFKVVSMAAILEHGAPRLNQRVFCENGLLLTEKRKIRDTKPHGWLTPYEIVARSSNIGMVKLAKNLTQRELWETVHSFGFGEQTGIELPGESAGSFLDVSRWSGFSHDSISFGQEIGVTAIQMASALGIVANDGVLVPPRVVLGTRDESGELRPKSPEKTRRVISTGTARHVRAMMERVVEKGTGMEAAIDGYRIGGKTGTAQKKAAGRTGYSTKHHIASFGGFGPGRDPRLVGLVLVDSPSGEIDDGGRIAAPVFRRIFTAALRHLRIPSDDEPGFDYRVAAAPQPRRPPSAAPSAQPGGFAPDVRGMSLRRASSTLAASGCRVQARGTGYVARQEPAAGAQLAPGSKCMLRLEPRAAGVPGSRRSRG
ncbi:MAG: transpeptidase family protein [bacterium]|nr:transpeptidase family protein [bacterium]